MYTKSTLGSRIVALRKEKHFTVTDFAKLLNINVRNIYNYEKDAVEPKLSFFDAIDKKLPDISLHWLMFGSGDMFSDQPLVELEKLRETWGGVGVLSDYLTLVKTVVELDKRVSRLESI